MVDNYLIDVPDDIIFLIFSFCDFRCASKLSRTCKRIHQLTTQYPTIWEYQLMYIKCSGLYDAPQIINQIFENRKQKKKKKRKAKNPSTDERQENRSISDSEISAKIFSSLKVELISRRLQLIPMLMKSPPFPIKENEVQLIIHYRQFLWDNLWWMLRHCDYLCSGETSESLRSSVSALKNINLGDCFKIDMNLKNQMKKNAHSYHLIVDYQNRLLDTLIDYIKDYDGVTLPAFSLILHAIQNQWYDDVPIIEKLYKTKTDVKSIMERGRNRWLQNMVRNYQMDFIKEFFNSDELENITPQNIPSLAMSYLNVPPFRVKHDYSKLITHASNPYDYSNFFYFVRNVVFDNIFAQIFSVKDTTSILTLLNNDMLWLGLDKVKLISHLAQNRPSSSHQPPIVCLIDNIELWGIIYSLGVQTHDSPYFHPNNLLALLIRNHGTSNPLAMKYFQELVDHPFYQNDPKQLDLPALHESYGYHIETPLEVSVYLEETAFTQILLKAGANPNFKCCKSINHLFDLCKNVAQMQLLIQYGALKSFKSCYLFSLLTRSNPELFKYLIEKGGFDVNIYSNEGSTLLFHAILNLQSDQGVDLVKFLLEHGANPLLESKMVPYQNMNPIQYARNVIDQFGDAAINPFVYTMLNLMTKSKTSTNSTTTTSMSTTNNNPYRE